MSDQINVNEIANTLQTKVDLPDGVSQSQCDFVVEWKAPTSADPTWYRKYKSGWVEQGGYISANNVREIGSSITLPKEMLNSNYSVLLSPQSIYRSDTNAWNICIGYRIISPSVLIVNSYGLGTSDLQSGLTWKVEGFAATN